MAVPDRSCLGQNLHVCFCPDSPALDFSSDAPPLGRLRSRRLSALPLAPAPSRSGQATAAPAATGAGSLPTPTQPAEKRRTLQLNRQLQ